MSISRVADVFISRVLNRVYDWRVPEGGRYAQIWPKAFMELRDKWLKDVREPATTLDALIRDEKWNGGIGCHRGAGTSNNWTPSDWYFYSLIVSIMEHPDEWDAVAKMFRSLMQVVAYEEGVEDGWRCRDVKEGWTVEDCVECLRGENPSECVTNAGGASTAGDEHDSY